MKIKAVGLLSGGLDSMLAAAIIEGQGIEVLGVYFYTGFNSPVLNRSAHSNSAENSFRVPIEVIDISEEFKPILANPKHGYGSAINPCIDCHILMIKKAREYMEAKKAHFIFTGEVLAQRPMSQHRQTLALVAREAGVEDCLVRPLSAKLLPPTEPEKRGRIDREKLYDINGRGRKRQMALAEKFGIKNYPQPAGGCILTDENYARRLKDFWKRKGEKTYTKEETLLLRIGRHLRLSDKIKIIVARNEAECNILERRSEGRALMRPTDVKGAVALIEGECPTDDELQTLAGITAFYGAGKKLSEVNIEFFKDGETKIICVKPAALDFIDKTKI